MNYIANSFSLNMLNISEEVIIGVRKVDVDAIPEEVASYIGHPDVATVASALLGKSLQVNRESLELDADDKLYVAQYIGSRLPEGATELPNGAKMQYFEVFFDG